MLSPDEPPKGQKPAIPILVAEDDSVVADMIRFSLASSGFGVTVATDGEQAWRLAQEESFAAVIADISMPRMCGLELIERLRSLPSYAQAPIFLVTAKQLELDYERTEKLKVAKIFHKPFSPRELVRSLREQLQEGG